VTGAAAHVPPAPPPAAAARRHRHLLDFEGWTAEEVGNVAMFVPLGALFPLRFRRWAWWTVPVGVVVSGAIELTQRLFLDRRSPTLRDIWFNGVGTVIGFALWLAWRTVVRQPPAA